MTADLSDLLCDLAGQIEEARTRVECAGLAVEGAIQDERHSNAITTVLEDAITLMTDGARDVRLIGLGRLGGS